MISPVVVLSKVVEQKRLVAKFSYTKIFQRLILRVLWSKNDKSFKYLQKLTTKINRNFMNRSSISFVAEYVYYVVCVCMLNVSKDKDYSFTQTCCRTIKLKKKTIERTRVPFFFKPRVFLLFVGKPVMCYELRDRSCSLKTFHIVLMKRKIYICTKRFGYICFWHDMLDMPGLILIGG